MKPIRVTLIATALAVLGGCVAGPVDSGYYGNGYYAPSGGYYGSPYYGPAIGIGIYGGRHYYRDGGRRDHDHGYRHGGRRGDGNRDGHRDGYRDGRR